ncbi:uncharacterized protein LOC113290265 [Papaver somniferum]|uniref:uncharacterized protein LOC113290265 n=1 Tax=Papaver somniferum TaxID=3469 RepID=UPI000E703886|nr:uncharacterized protein LOC113290265 [Papaver somniferum]
MACLALSLQPANGSTILLQTREWFPPARALAAVSGFQQTCMAFAAAAGKQNKNLTSGEDIIVSNDDTSLGDDPLAASSGQLIVGTESKYRVVYRLVNGIYVLGITTVDHDNSVNNNVFECIGIVNQAVSVIVAACRGVDVTREKINKKYAEIYMAMDIVLKGVSGARLAALLGSMRGGDGIAKMMVHSGIDAENRIRGGENWSDFEYLSVEHETNVDLFLNVMFELPPETLAAGDEVARALIPLSVRAEKEELVQEKKPEGGSETEKDPFAASDVIGKPEELVGGFVKSKEASSASDLSALTGLDLTTLPPAEATQSTHIVVEGFEGNYGGVEYSNQEETVSEAFEGFHGSAFDGGMDASEFVDQKKISENKDMGGLELLNSVGDVVATPVPSGTGETLENLLVKKTEMKGPEMYISEEINVEFRESILARVSLLGTVFLKTLPPKIMGDKECEFSFCVEGTSGVKRFVMQNSLVSSLGNGLFHLRGKSSEEPVPVLKYSLLPRLTPLPLRVRMVTRHSGTLLSVMIQYVSNPDLPAPLNDVTFVLKLPVDPTLLMVFPKAALNRSGKELSWHIQEIPLNGPPGVLRVRMPVDINEQDSVEEIEVFGYVKFSVQGTRSLSGVSLQPATDGKTDFYEANHRFATGVYMCN